MPSCGRKPGLKIPSKFGSSSLQGNTGRVYIRECKRINQEKFELKLCDFSNVFKSSKFCLCLRAKRHETARLATSGLTSMYVLSLSSF